MAQPGRTLWVTVGPETMAVVLGAAATAAVAFGVANSARRTLGWVVACAVVASLVAPLVSALGRRLPRGVAVAVALLLVGAAGASVAGGLLADLGNQYDRLERVAPQAAAELERSDRTGPLARDFRLEARVRELLDRLSDPTSGLGSEVPSRASTFLLCGILTAFFIYWGPRVTRAAVKQVPDPEVQASLRTVVGTGFSRAQSYALAGVGRAVVAGLVAGALCRLEGVPAAVVMAVAVGALSIIPGFGILIGSLPALLLEAGLGSGSGALRLAVAFLALQVLDAFVLRRLVAPRSLTVGPAAILIALVVGFEVYGVGGAFYGAALAVFGVALLDAAGEHPAQVAAGAVPAAGT
ncbi:MAG: AI-2E family transporter [Acidimicrobiia bacterium]